MFTGLVLGSADTTVNETDKSPWPHLDYITVGAMYTQK